MKYVLVTGACGGMGQATVQRLCADGYTVFAMDIKPSAEQEHVIPIVADVTDMDSLEQAYQQVHRVADRLFAIIHFAGVYMLDSLVEIPEEAFVSAFNINVFGAYRVNKIFASLLDNGSRIVITTSELAPLEPLPFTGLYAITKSTLDKYAASLRMELQLLGVSVSVLRPGAVQTDMLGVSMEQLDRFTDGTYLYRCNAKRFHKIVDSVEGKHIPAEKVARKVFHILKSKRARPVYQLNRNPLLRLLDVLPIGLQTCIIRRILK